jgi:hypothetical protein
VLCEVGRAGAGRSHVRRRAPRPAARSSSSRGCGRRPSTRWRRSRSGPGRQLGSRRPRRAADALQRLRRLRQRGAGARASLVAITKAWELGRRERWVKGRDGYDLVVLDALPSGHGVGMLRTPAHVRRDRARRPDRLAGAQGRRAAGGPGAQRGPRRRPSRGAVDQRDARPRGARHRRRRAPARRGRRQRRAAAALQRGRGRSRDGRDGAVPGAGGRGRPGASTGRPAPSRASCAGCAATAPPTSPRCPTWPRPTSVSRRCAAWPASWRGGSSPPARARAAATARRRGRLGFRAGPPSAPKAGLRAHEQLVERVLGPRCRPCRASFPASSRGSRSGSSRGPGR